MKNEKHQLNNKDVHDETYVTIPLNKKLLKYVLLVITFTIILFWVVNHTDKLVGLIEKLLSLVAPFAIGLCVSFIINTILCPLEELWDKIWKKSKSKHITKFKRPVCLCISTLIVIGAIFAILFMLIPEIINTVVTLINMLPQFIKNLDAWWKDIIVILEDYNIVLPSFDFDFSKIIDTINNFISNYGEMFINTTVNITTSIVTFVVNIILAFVFSIYLLSQKERIGRQTKKVLYALFPKKRTEKILDFASLTNQSFSKFVMGQLLEAVIIGVLCFIGMLIFKMPYAGVISILVGFTALIPVFGAFIGTAIGAFLILLVNPAKALWFIIFIIILQQLEGNLIYPKVVGKSVGLPGIWVLVAVTIGGGAFGVIGMLFSVPVCSILYCVVKELVSKRTQTNTEDV